MAKIIAMNLINTRSKCNISSKQLHKGSKQVYVLHLFINEALNLRCYFRWPITTTLKPYATCFNEALYELVNGPVCA